ncbi:hypothetical protein [Stenotrophomonas sp. GZD-301]|uniref:hypothetical protein n=1 Tax=Stenotrophomonas sp. GZD-301 TaxID=3404814 RepID=UPI003BB7E4D1
MKRMALLLMVAGVAGSGAAAAQDADKDEELAVAVKAYMASHDRVTMDEAVRRLQVQAELAPFSENLQGEFAERFTAIRLMDSPDQYIRVDLTGDRPVPPRVIQTASGQTRVEFRVGRVFTQEEFRTRLKDSAPLIRSLIPGVSGITGFAGDNRVVVSIEGNADEAARYARVLPKIERASGLKVELEHSQGRERNASDASGGAVLQNNNDYCTTGFAVLHKATNTRGIITAAHCPDALIYGNYGSTQNNTKVSFPLTFQNAIFDGSHDVQWHSIPAPHGVTQEVFGSSNSEYGKRSIMFLYAAPMENTNLCFRGAVSGYSCGQVVSVTHVPEGTCGATIVCNPDWVRVEGTSLSCTGGDSGAAVFWQNSGYGIVKSAKWTGVGAGNCDRLTVMPFGRVSALGLRGL